jgi:hypothetical protein
MEMRQGGGSGEMWILAFVRPAGEVECACHPLAGECFQRTFQNLEEFNSWAGCDPKKHLIISDICEENAADLMPTNAAI